MPELAACAKDANVPLPDSDVPPAALVMVGSDLGPRCSGTIVHLDATSAYVVSARHCFTDASGELHLPPQRARVFLVREDAQGSFWEPRPVLSVVKGEASAAQSSWARFKLDHGDWIVFTLAREPSMRAVALADAPLREKVPAAMLTVRWQSSTGRPCLHDRRFEWGATSPLGLAGYSGAAVVANGRVQGLFVGYETDASEQVSFITLVPAESIARPWAAAPSVTPNLRAP